MSSAAHEIFDLQESAQNDLIFNHGLKYLIDCISSCWLNILQCQIFKKSGKKEVFDLIHKLRAQIDFFCSYHSRFDEKEDIDGQHLKMSQKDQITVEKDLILNIQGKYQTLNSQLNIQKRRNYKLLKAKLRIKNRSKRLLVRLKRLRNENEELRTSQKNFKAEEETNYSIAESNLNKTELKEDKESQTSTKEVEKDQDLDSVKKQKIQKEEVESTQKDLKIVEKKSRTPTKQAPEVPKEQQAKPKTPKKNKKVEQSNLQNLKVKVDKLKNLQKSGIIGEGWTYIALKSPESYLIGSSMKGLKLHENSKGLYQAKLKGDGFLLNDIIYVKNIDSYFLAWGAGLYRKDIDDKPPYLFVDIDCGWRCGACLRYSDLNNKLFVSKEGTYISVIDIKQKKQVIQVEEERDQDLTDFRIFGEKQDLVVSLKASGILAVYRFNFKKKGKNYSIEDSPSKESELDMGLIEQRHEVAVALEVGSQNRFFLVEIEGSGQTSLSSRMMVAKFEDKKLTKMATLDNFKEKFGNILAFCSLGYFGKNLIWVGLSLEKNGCAKIYCYDTERSELRELKEKRVEHQELYPYRLHKLGQAFYYTGYTGKLMRLSIGN